MHIAHCMHTEKNPHGRNGMSRARKSHTASPKVEGKKKPEQHTKKCLLPTLVQAGQENNCSWHPHIAAIGLHIMASRKIFSYSVSLFSQQVHIM